MGFAAPGFLWGLTALPVLAALYWFSRRSRVLPVAWLRLWTAGPRPPSPGRTWKWRRFPPVFFLELLMLALLCAAAAQPYWVVRSEIPPLTAILDDSFSMRAGPAGQSPRARARAELLALARQYPEREFRVVTAGREARNAGTAPGRALAALLDRGWRAEDTACDLGGARDLLRRLGRGNSEIRIYTDRPEPGFRPEPGMSLRAFGVPRENRAIVGAVRDATRAVAVIANAGPAECRIGVRCGARTREIRIASGGAETVEFRDLPPDRPVTVELTDAADELDFDNSVTLLPEPPQPVRVELRLSDEKRAPVAAALHAVRNLRTVADRPELIVTDRETGLDPNTPGLVLRSGTGRTLAGRAERAGAPPLTAGIDWQPVLWSEPAAPPPGTPLLRVGQRVTAARSNRRITAVWDPSSSNWHRTPAWPAWFANLADDLTANRPGVRKHNFRAGEPVEVRLPPGTRELTVTTPWGRQKFHPDFRGRVRLESPPGGAVELAAGDARWPIRINPLSRTESDLGNAASGIIETPDTSRKPTGRNYFGWTLALAVLALGMLHQWVLARPGQGGDA